MIKTLILTCNSVISFSATFGSEWFAAAPPATEWEWEVAGQEAWRAPQNAAAEFPPMSIMLDPCTCIIVHITSQTELDDLNTVSE